MSLRQHVKKVIPKKVFEAIEPVGHKAEAMLVSTKYGFPAKDLRVIGVTGTNGKTTTCFMIHKMLVEAGYKVGLMTTVAYGVGDKITPQVAHMTSVSAPLLQKRLKAFKEQGAEWVVLETTSHALAQYRVWGVPYEIAVMTNLTHEHLDYHGTLNHYLKSKVRLFQAAGKSKCGFGVVNADDEYHLAFANEVPRSVSYGIESGDLRAKNIKLQSDGVEYTVEVNGEKHRVRSQIPGKFNVSNSLAAVAVGLELGIDMKQIVAGIAALEGVEGRMATVDVGQKYGAIIDFAHTPDSFERLLADLRKATRGKLVVLFGSAGRRDEEKRAVQGRIAGKYADEVVITEEDDRDIDGNEIMEQIAAGAEESGKQRDKDLFMILDRPSAIDFAITRVKGADDTVVFLGKGHERTIERADGTHPWDEVAEVKRAILASN